jgi:hypothetical protein
MHILLAVFGAIALILGGIVKFPLLRKLLVIAVPFLFRHWRRRKNKRPSPDGAPPAATKITLSLKEAAEMLDIDAQASKGDILAAHKRLMKKLHPDAGGSHYFATRLNAARDLLIAQRKRA